MQIDRNNSEMTDAEAAILKALDGAMAADPAGLTPNELRLYRKLLDKHVSELILTVGRADREAGRGGFGDWRLD